MKIYKQLNILNKNLKVTNEQKKIFKYLKRGDIISAKVQYFSVNLRNVLLAKQYINYLVVYKSLKYVYALKLEDAEYKENNYITYIIKANKYNGIEKDYFVDFKEIYQIPICDISSKKFSLDIEDQKHIKRILAICKERIVGPYDDSKFDLNVPLEILPGDIIDINGVKYLVYYINASSLVCYELLDSNYNEQVSDKTEDLIKIVIGGNEYYVDKTSDNIDLQYFNKFPKFSLIDFASDEEIENIMQILN